MKKTITVIISVIISIATLAQAPSIQWQKMLGGTSNDMAYSAIQTTDGGYAIAGESFSNNGDVSGNHSQSIDFWIAKTDNLGNLQWQKSLGGSKTDKAYSIVQTADGGYAIAGRTESTNGDVTGLHGTIDWWVVKLNGSGNLQWQKTLGGTANEIAYSIKQTNDGGYIVAGSTASNDGDLTGLSNGGACGWIVKLNPSGNIQWQKVFTGVLPSSIIQTTDSGYAVTGSSDQSSNIPGNHGIYDYFLIKMNGNGAIEWEKCYGGSNSDDANCIIQTTDGGYALAGNSRSNDGDVTGHHGTTTNDYWIVKLNTTGVIQWQRSFGGSTGNAISAGEDWANAIIQTNDGGYAIVGQSTSFDGDVTGYNGEMDYWMVKTDASGNLQWQKAMGGLNWDEAHSVIQATDGGFVVAGLSSASGTHGNQDYWLVKLACTVPSSSITATNTTICANDSAQLCAPAGLAGYNWNTGANTSCIYTSLAGNYYVTVTDNNGCAATSNHVAITVYPLPSVSISLNGDTLTAYSSALYQWYRNGSPINGANTNVYIATEGGNYFVKVTDANGCEAFSSDIVISDVQDLNNELGITISPNPINNLVDVIFSNTPNTQYFLEIIDITGKKISSQTLTRKNNSVDMATYPNGIYVLRIKDESSRIEFVKKVLKQ